MSLRYIHIRTYSSMHARMHAGMLACVCETPGYTDGLFQTNSFCVKTHTHIHICIHAQSLFADLQMLLSRSRSWSLLQSCHSHDNGAMSLLSHRRIAIMWPSTRVFIPDAHLLLNHHHLCVCYIASNWHCHGCRQIHT